MSDYNLDSRVNDILNQLKQRSQSEQRSYPSFDSNISLSESDFSLSNTESVKYADSLERARPNYVTTADDYRYRTQAFSLPDNDSVPYTPPIQPSAPSNPWYDTQRQSIPYQQALTDAGRYYTPSGFTSDDSDRIYRQTLAATQSFAAIKDISTENPNTSFSSLYEQLVGNSSYQAPPSKPAYPDRKSERSVPTAVRAEAEQTPEPRFTQFNTQSIDYTGVEPMYKSPIQNPPPRREHVISTFTEEVRQAPLASAFYDANRPAPEPVRTPISTAEPIYDYATVKEQTVLDPSVETFRSYEQSLDTDRAYRQPLPEQTTVPDNGFVKNQNFPGYAEQAFETTVQNTVEDAVDNSEQEDNSSASVDELIEKTFGEIDTDKGFAEIVRTEKPIEIEASDRNGYKSVLNLAENVGEEEFKSFFSDNVIVNDKRGVKKKSSAPRQKQKKISDFVVSDGETDGGPVFEENDDEQISEYCSPSDTEQVLSDLLHNKAEALVKLLITAVLSVILVFVNASFTAGRGVFAVSNSTTVAVINLIAAVGVIAVNRSRILKSIGKLLLFKADAKSLVSLCMIMGLVDPIAAIVGGDDRLKFGFMSCVAVTSVALADLGIFLKSCRILDNFRTITGEYDKFATVAQENTPFTRSISEQSEQNRVKVLLKRKTGFTENFLSYSDSSYKGISTYTKLYPIAVAVCIVCGVVAIIRTKDFSAAVRSAGIAFALASPFVSTLVSEFPMLLLQKRLSRVGCVVPGFSAAEEIVDANNIIFEGRELFPNGNVLLRGIKTFNRERIDRAILYAASVLIPSCDTMSPMFLNVIQNKTDMLYSAENIECEKGLGFTAWVEKKRIVIGCREMLEKYGIPVLTHEAEDKYTVPVGGDAVYLAVGGKPFAMFVVSYTAASEVEKIINGIVREGINVIVRTNDFNITSDKIAGVYAVRRSAVVVSFEDDRDDTQPDLSYVASSTSLMTHLGSVSSYFGGILSCHRLSSSLRIASVIELASVLVGATLAVAVTVFGSGIGAVTALLFQLAWFAAFVATMLFIRY